MQDADNTAIAALSRQLSSGSELSEATESGAKEQVPAIIETLQEELESLEINVAVAEATSHLEFRYDIPSQQFLCELDDDTYLTDEIANKLSMAGFLYTKVFDLCIAVIKRFGTDEVEEWGVWELLDKVRTGTVGAYRCLNASNPQKTFPEMRSTNEYLIKSLTDKILPLVKDKKAEVRCIKHIGDYNRYLAECANDPNDIMKYKEITAKWYDKGMDIAKEHLEEGDCIRLMLANNASLFCMRMRMRKKGAVMAYTAIWSAMNSDGHFDGKSYQCVESMRDNLVDFGEDQNLLLVTGFINEYSKWERYAVPSGIINICFDYYYYPLEIGFLCQGMEHLTQVKME